MDLYGRTYFIYILLSLALRFIDLRGKFDVCGSHAGLWSSFEPNGTDVTFWLNNKNIAFLEERYAKFAAACAFGIEPFPKRSGDTNSLIELLDARFGRA